MVSIRWIYALVFANLALALLNAWSYRAQTVRIEAYRRATTNPERRAAAGLRWMF